MNVKEFFTKYTNQFIDYDNHYGAQCMDLYRQYCKEVLGLQQSPAVAGAADVWNTHLQDKFIAIANTPTGIPQLGDIIIWNKKLNGYGHIAVCQSANVLNFTSFDQNFPTNSPCHLQKHNYKYVIGWLRPIIAPIITKPSILPTVPLQIARIGLHLPPGHDFIENVMHYSSGKISCVLNDYNADLGRPQTLTQDMAYALVDKVKPKEKFIFIFYTPVPGASYNLYTTYYYPSRDSVITTCPAVDPRLLAFEFAHQVQLFYNSHRGSNPWVEIIDTPGASGPTDILISAKYSSVADFYNK